VTNDGYVDLVQDWQPLQDTQPPVVRALPSTGRRRHGVRLRFRVSEDSQQAAVSVGFRYSIKNGFSEAQSGTVLHWIRPGHTYSLSFPWEAVKTAPASFRFCVQAVDGSVNQSARSCARFHFVRSRKKR
jgi:hypothetical protein